MIKALIYDQEGNLLPFNMKDSVENELFREWLARHDRHPDSGIKAEKGQ